VNVALTSICYWASPRLILGVNQPLTGKLTTLINPQSLINLDELQLHLNRSCGSLLWYTPNLEHFGTFKSIEDNMKWGFGVNSHVEINY